MKTPNCSVLETMQEYSTRGWVYREGQGWIFAELTPVQYKERIFIYAIVDELAREAYIGHSGNLRRRLAQHLRGTENPDKVAMIQRLRAQGREPKLRELEEVAGKEASGRERYWTSYYKRQGYTIINKDFR